MRYFVVVILLVCLVIPANISGVEVPIFGKGSAIDALMERAVACNLIAGGVVVVGNRDGILYTSARGTLNRHPDAPPLNECTMFDVASLTKVMATAPAVMKLVEEGKVSLSDPVSRWFPEFRNPKKKDITIHHLLTHTSGLADFDLKKGAGIKTAIRKAAAEKNGQRAGSCFNYADINFIILGELVYRVSGKTLDRYCTENIYTPLGAVQTMFLPPAGLRGEIAPVLGFTSGIVGDGNARRLGGVAGHAGVFSSGGDIARYARLILNGGVIDGRRIFSERTVELMTAPNRHGNGSVVRGLGWDMESPFSAPRGNFFSKTSFGHTGYSGSSVWIDPERDLFVVVLTNRLNFYDTKTFNLFRGDVSTIAAADFGKQDDDWLPSQGELTQMIADLLDARSRVVPASPPKVVKVAARADKKMVAKRQVKKLVKVAKVGKDLRRKPVVRSRRA